MPRECVLCGEVDSEETPLLELPCFNHWTCRDACLADFFEKATSNESLFPPQCCDEPILIDRFAEHVPEDVQLAFRLKEQGEYTILPKYRVYCANSTCGKFLHPNGHIKDADSGIIYVVCDNDDCFLATCCCCKTLLADGIAGHFCKIEDHDQKFKETVDEKGYKECFVCGATVELAEACNHITCECGNSFCYVCGKEWNGMHGCPQYGPARYDDDGYNQDGFHRDTGLNREGRTRREQVVHQNGEDDDDEDDEEGEPEIEDMWEQIMQHVDPDRRGMIENMGPNERDDAMMLLQIEFIDQGIVFNIPQPQQQDGGDSDSDDEDESGEDDGEGETDDEANGEDDAEDDEGDEPLVAEFFQGIGPNGGDGEPTLGNHGMPVVVPTSIEVPSSDQGNEENDSVAADEDVIMIGSDAVRSNTASSPDGLSLDTPFSAESPVTSPEEFADTDLSYSDQENIWSNRSQ